MSLRPNSRTEVRKKSYKTGVDADEARRRREDNMVEIRKSKREDNLLKKRREGMLLQSQQLPDSSQTPAAIEKRLHETSGGRDRCFKWSDGENRLLRRQKHRIDATEERE